MNLVYKSNAVVEVTKEFTFDSCHQLLGYKGACERLHGHTYKLQVTVKGTPDYRGMVLDFKELKSICKLHIVEHLDHYNLNDKLPYNTTAENMVVHFYDIIKRHLEDTNIEVVSVRLWETPTSYAEYRGELV